MPSQQATGKGSIQIWPRMEQPGQTLQTPNPARNINGTAILLPSGAEVKHGDNKNEPGRLLQPPRFAFPE